LKKFSKGSRRVWLFFRPARLKETGGRSKAIVDRKEAIVLAKDRLRHERSAGIAPRLSGWSRLEKMPLAATVYDLLSLLHARGKIA